VRNLAISEIIKKNIMIWAIINGGSEAAILPIDKKIPKTSRK